MGDSQPTGIGVMGRESVIGLLWLPALGLPSFTSLHSSCQITTSDATILHVDLIHSLSGKMQAPKGKDFYLSSPDIAPKPKSF